MLINQQHTTYGFKLPFPNFISTRKAPKAPKRFEETALNHPRSSSCNHNSRTKQHSYNPSCCCAVAFFVVLFLLLLLFHNILIPGTQGLFPQRNAHYKNNASNFSEGRYEPLGWRRAFKASGQLRLALHGPYCYRALGARLPPWIFQARLGR